MGFSSSVTVLIFFSSFLLLAGIMINTQSEYQNMEERALEEQSEMEMEKEKSELSLYTMYIHNSTLYVYLENSGETVMDLSDNDLIINGIFQNSISTEVDGEDVRFLNQNDMLEISIANIILNSTAHGGDRDWRIQKSLGSPKRVTSDKYVHVLDDTVVRTYSTDGELIWSENSGMLSGIDIASGWDCVYTLGEDNVSMIGYDGIGGFSRIINDTTLENAEMICFFVSSDATPYLVIMESSGDIWRTDRYGSGAQKISINGTNVNWTDPVDLISGNECFYVLESNGSIYRISKEGEDTFEGKITLSGNDVAIAGSSNGPKGNQILVLINGDGGSSVAVYNTTENLVFLLIDSIGDGVCDISTSCGVYAVDDEDVSLSRYELGAKIRFVSIFGYTFAEVV